MTSSASVPAVPVRGSVPIYSTAHELEETRDARPSEVAAAHGGGSRRRTILALVGGGLAGLLAGIDVLLLCLLEALLRGADADSVDVPGMGFAAWTAEGGLAYGLGPSAVAIAVAMTGAGAAVGWMCVRARRSGRPASPQA